MDGPPMDGITMWSGATTGMGAEFSSPAPPPPALLTAT
jgi:hypothetical protein